jgi:acyl carrier protein phosphodiesterase
MHSLVDAMSQDDWLRAYASQRGIERVLRGMAARHPVAAEIGTAGRLLSDSFDRFSTDFDEFLPDLRARCTEFLAERNVG